MDYEKNIAEAAEYIKSKCSFSPRIGIILGSGLGDFADSIENAEVISYGDIPHFPKPTVEGHDGKFIISNDILCMKGRFHYYEGYDMKDVTFPIRVMSSIGIKDIVVTNASGGVNKSFSSGDLMVITDHINFMGTNPLIGKNLSSFGERFPDMSEAYCKKYIELAESVALEKGIDLKKGIYAAFTGPSYETPAEINMAAIFGADAVGMSTVPECIVANHCGMNVLGISCITNMAAGIKKGRLSHDEVIKAGTDSKAKFKSLLKGIIERI